MEELADNHSRQTGLHDGPEALQLQNIFMTFERKAPCCSYFHLDGSFYYELNSADQRPAR